RFFPYPYNGFMVWWIGIVLLTNLIFSTMIKREIKRMELNNDSNVNLEGKKPLLRRYIERMTKENPYREEITLKMEYIRKSFHLTGLLLILAYFGLPFMYPVTRIISDGVIELINNIEPAYNLLWGDLSLFPFVIGDPISNHLAVAYLTMMALIGALMFALISDLIRIIWGPEYSVFNFLTRSMLRQKEMNAAGPQIYIITGFVFSFMLYMVNLVHIFVVFSGIIIACLSDAAAAIIGRKYGKHKVTVRNKDTKSIEGFLAGTIVAYLIGLIFVGPIYAIIGGVIFLITDYFPIFTADNLLNPIFIPIGIQLFILILGLPVGW
ncbi:MAG: phosphatidate cytidylyltransferase, partial [Candidatus Thorarchaeota archaeon]